MPTKFSQFINGGAPVAGDMFTGLRNGLNTLFSVVPAPTPFLTWSTLVLGQPLVIDNGYFMDNPAPAVYTLPLVAPVGGLIQIINVSASTFTIAQNAGQSIRIGNAISTVGVAGNIQSLTPGDAIILVCYVANSSFVNLTAPEGIWPIV